MTPPLPEPHGDSSPLLAKKEWEKGRLVAFVALGVSAFFFILGLVTLSMATQVSRLVGIPAGAGAVVELSSVFMLVSCLSVVVSFVAARWNTLGK